MSPLPASSVLAALRQTARRNLHRSRARARLALLALSGVASACGIGEPARLGIGRAALQVERTVAHRGASADYPENSLPGIAAAIDAGIDAVEADVRTTADGHLVLLHDARLDRTTDGSGPLADTSLAQLARLDAGRWFDPSHTGVRVPTLEQALRLARGKIALLLDLKQQGAAYDTAVAAAVRRHGEPATIILGVRSVEQAVRLRKLLPGAAQLGFVPQPREIEPFAAAGVETIRLKRKWLRANSQLAARVAATGAALHLGSKTGSRADVAEILRYEPSSVMTDAPVTLLESLAYLRGWAREQGSQQP